MVTLAIFLTQLMILGMLLVGAIRERMWVVDTWPEYLALGLGLWLLFHLMLFMALVFYRDRT